MKVIITGASGGLGRAFACECACRGYDLLLTDMNEKLLEDIKQGIQKQFKNIQVLSFCCDIVVEGQVDKLCEFAIKNNFSPNILLNIAGIDFEGSFEHLSCENARRIVDVNINGTMLITHKVLDIRDKNNKFYIMFVSSFASKQPMPLKATYAASKRYLLDFSLALGEELKEKNIYTMALCPSGMPTNDGCIELIKAQGFWGRATTVKLNDVTRKSLDYMFRGRKTYVPGLANKFIEFLLFFTPPKLAARYVYKRWHKSQEKLEIQ